MGQLKKFIDDYLDEFVLIQDRIEQVFLKSFEDAGCSTGRQKYNDLKVLLDNLRNFSCADQNEILVEQKLGTIDNELQYFTQDSERTKNLFKPIHDDVTELLQVFRSSRRDINNKVGEIYERIHECPCGAKEHGIPFQDSVLAFFDWVFIHEFVRSDINMDEGRPKKKIRNIKMDGFYNKLDSFDAKERTTFSFQQMIIECKNKRPDINDLMQCLKFTLYFQTNELSKVPLTLLVCRSKPGHNSTVWDINKKIFDKKIENETRLIIILSVEDLKEMKEIKASGGDPAKVIKTKIADYV